VVGEIKDGDMRDVTREPQTERDALREPRCETLDDVRVAYGALARRWRVYANPQVRQR
jgi:hypothetical protein